MTERQIVAQILNGWIHLIRIRLQPGQFLVCVHQDPSPDLGKLLQRDGCAHSGAIGMRHIHGNLPDLLCGEGYNGVLDGCMTPPGFRLPTNIEAAEQIVILGDIVDHGGDPRWSADWWERLRSAPRPRVGRSRRLRLLLSDRGSRPGRHIAYADVVDKRRNGAAAVGGSF